MNDKTSLNENKNVGKIKFEEFPGDNKTKIVSKENKKEKPIKQKKELYTFLIISALVIVLSFLASFLNIRMLNGDFGDYKLYNKFNGKYAKISSSNKNNLFKKIGFKEYSNEVMKKDGISYNASYAYNVINEEKDIKDYIIVYYDNKNNVKYVEVNLNFNDDEFYLDNVYKDSNNLINNFIKTDLNKDRIIDASESLNNEFKQDSITYLVKNEKILSNYSVNIKVGE